MIELSNLRKEKNNGIVKLIADINLSDNHPEFTEKTIWISICEENSDFLSDENYDPFVLIPYAIGMFYNEPLKINGYISKTLYKNIKFYASQILEDFSNHTKKIDLIVDGFKEVTKKDCLVGTSCSCGIDSLNCLYDHFELENDKDFKINSLFLFNCGTHGDFNDESHKLYEDRLNLNKRAAKAMNLPIYTLDSNIHAFSHVISPGDEAFGYLSIYSCILALETKVSKYFVGSDFSYSQTLKIGRTRRDIDLSEYNAASFVPLIYTENIKLILDGAQNIRSLKTARIADWDIAQKYMNICVKHDHSGKNCSTSCYKCKTAMLIYDSLNKLENFKESFDIESYKKNRGRIKKELMKEYNFDPFTHDAIDFVMKNGTKMPSKLISLFNKKYIYDIIKPLAIKIIGKKNCHKLKSIVK